MHQDNVRLLTHWAIPPRAWTDTLSPSDRQSRRTQIARTDARSLPPDEATALQAGGFLTHPAGRVFGGSDHADVLCFLALLARSDVELDTLALIESAVSVHPDC